MLYKWTKNFLNLTRKCNPSFVLKLIWNDNEKVGYILVWETWWFFSTILDGDGPNTWTATSWLKLQDACIK
jgi:hypothetical protein